MTDPFVLQVGCSTLQPMIIYHLLSLQVRNAGGLEQATAYISLLTLHSTIAKQQHPCLSKWHLCNDMKQFTSLNTLNRYCIEHTCFGISSFGSDNSNASKAVRNSYTATHRCFVIFHFVASGHSVQL